MSAHKSARPIGAGQTKEAGAHHAAGATETSFRSEEVSRTNHPAPAPKDEAGELSIVSGVLDPASTSNHQPWSDPEALKQLPEPDLAAAINSGYETTRSAVHSAKRHNANALAGALRAGALLGEVHRREGKSGFGPWVQKNCPELPLSTAYRYWKLARKFPHVRTDKEIVGLRQAYVAVDIIPEKPTEKNKKAPDLTSMPMPTGTDVLTRVQSNRAFLGAELGRVNPTTMDAAALDALLAEINALIDQLTAVRKVISRAQQMVAADALPAEEKEAA